MILFSSYLEPDFQVQASAKHARFFSLSSLQQFSIHTIHLLLVLEVSLLGEWLNSKIAPKESAMIFFVSLSLLITYLRGKQMWQHLTHVLMCITRIFSLSDKMFTSNSSFRNNSILFVVDEITLRCRMKLKV